MPDDCGRITDPGVEKLVEHLASKITFEQFADFNKRLSKRIRELERNPAFLRDVDIDLSDAPPMLKCLRCLRFGKDCKVEEPK